MLQLNKYFRFHFAILLFCAWACSANHQEQREASEADLEAREDSLELVAALEKQSKITAFVTPEAETKTIRAGSEEDAADDPAVWVHPADPAQSLIIGSNKRGGIAAYTLEGQEMAYYPVGNINNVDVVYGVAIGKQKIDLLGGSNRTKQSIDLFAIDPNTRQLAPIGVRPFLVDTALMDDIYGFCFYQNPKTLITYVLVNAKNGRLEQYEIVAVNGGQLDLKLVRTLKFDSQVEGMVADHARGHLYVGEEDRGVWKLSAEPTGSSERHLLAMSDESNPNISYDIEGLDLYMQGDTGYLIVSSQGNFSFAVFDRQGDNPYRLSFKIVEAGSVDGVEETDGIAIVSKSLGDKYPKGLLVTQDGFNTDGKQTQPQNFKLISWAKIEALLNKDVSK